MGGLGQLYVAPSSIRMPVLDIAYCAAMLRERNLEFGVLDAVASDLDAARALESVSNASPSLVCIRTSTPTIEHDLNFAGRIRDALPECRLLLFGPATANDTAQLAGDVRIDAVLLGEPERALVELAQGEWETVRGLWRRGENGVVPSSPRADILDLDALPFPAWDLFPWRNFNIGDGQPFFTVLASRGCPYSCTYCPYPVTQGKKWRHRSPGSVVAEVRFLVQEMGARSILFRDPEFTLRQPRVREICEQLIKEGIRVDWRCETRLDLISPDLIEIMGRAGCCAINFGIESPNETALEAVQRVPISREATFAVVEACRRHGVQSQCFFIIGLPTETRRDIIRLVDFAVELSPDMAQFTTATPYPGVGLREWAAERGYIETNDARAFTSYSAVMRNERLLVDELNVLARYARRSFARRRTTTWGRTKVYVRSSLAGIRQRLFGRRALRKIVAGTDSPVKTGKTSHSQ